MAQYGLIESFEVDDGQLNNYNAQECFVLGYEFSEICRKFSLFASGNGQLAHIGNIERLKSAALKRNKNIYIKYLSEDSSENWCEISWDSK